MPGSGDNSCRLKDRLKLDSEEEEVAKIIRGTHQIGENLKDSEIATIREKVEAARTARYIIQEDWLLLYFRKRWGNKT